jgi:hypothetical protein
MRKAKTEVKGGDQVRVRVPIPADYSGYGGLPSQDLTPDIAATVEAVGVPKVRIVSGPGKDGRDTFVLVSFHAAGRDWQAGVNYCNLVLVTS